MHTITTASQVYIPSRRNGRCTAAISERVGSPIAEQIMSSQPGEVMTLPDLGEFGPCLVSGWEVEQDRFTATLQAV